MHLWGRGDIRHGRAAYGAAEFGACFDASHVGGEAASPLGPAVALIAEPARIRANIHSGRVRARIGAVHLRPVERAVAGCRGERTLPVEIAPLAGERGAAESLLQRLDVIRHATAVRGIVLPRGRRVSRGPRPVDDHLVVHVDVGDVGDTGDVDYGGAARSPVAGAEEESRAHGDADEPGGYH